MRYPGTSQRDFITNRTSAKKTSKDFKASVETVIKEFSEMLNSHEREEVLEEFSMNLKGYKAELEQRIQSCTTDNVEYVETLFDLNDKIQHLLDLYCKARRSEFESNRITSPKKSIQTPNKATPESILDLDIFSDISIGTSSHPSDSPIRNTSIMAQFPTQGFSTASPMKYNNPTIITSPFIQSSGNSSTQNALSIYQPSSISEMSPLREENEKLKYALFQKQTDDNEKMIMINKLQTEILQLKIALDASRQELVYKDEVISKISSQNSHLSKSLAEALHNLEKYSKNSGFSSPKSPIKAISPKKSLISNFEFYRNCNSMARGVLYDDDHIQIGLQIANSDTEIIGMMYIGNKSVEPINEIATEIIDYPDDGLNLSITPLISNETINHGSQANRMIKASLHNFCGKIPIIHIKINEQHYNFHLPITAMRFLKSLNTNPEES